MSRERRRKHHRHAIVHQKQMRFWTIWAVVLVVAVFGLALYCINRWLNPLAT